MLEPVAVALKFGFLALLYIFLLWVVASAVRDLRGERYAEAGADDEEGALERARREPAFDLSGGVSPQLVVERGQSPAAGSSFDLGDGVTIGRSASADITIDDAFGSHMHARVFRRGPFLYIEDLGSTNGTFLNGRRLKHEEQLKVQDRVRIGETEFRYEE